VQASCEAAHRQRIDTLPPSPVGDLGDVEHIADEPVSGDLDPRSG
jgi:hypothetical protein